MATSSSDVLKVLKIAQTLASAILRTFKTSRVTINHEIYVRAGSYDFLFNYIFNKITQTYYTSLYALRTT